jgi:hypothetical protein
MASAADIEEVGCPEPAAAVDLIESIRSCWPSSRQPMSRFADTSPTFGQKDTNHPILLATVKAYGRVTACRKSTYFFRCSSAKTGGREGGAGERQFGGACQRTQRLHTRLHPRNGRSASIVAKLGSRTRHLRTSTRRRRSTNDVLDGRPSQQATPPPTSPRGDKLSGRRMGYLVHAKPSTGGHRSLASSRADARCGECAARTQHC